MEPLLKIENLQVSFDTYVGEVKAVRGISLEILEGEVLALVGESGCGKSVTAQTILKLNPTPPARIKSGTITLGGNNITDASEKEMDQTRGSLAGMIFQDPTMCLDPTMKIGHQLVEAIQIHRKLPKKAARAEAVKLMEMVQIPQAEKRLNHYPHQFSGGMCQRVMIAIALACHPKLLIADEPTTALDATIQRQIIDLIKDLRKRLGMSVMLITHDFSIVAGLADKIAVMYAGKIVEAGEVKSIFYDFKHPYTEALLKSLPSMETDPDDVLQSIPGAPPDLLMPIEGCAFAPRCHKKMRICLKSAPPNFEVAPKHYAACWCEHPDFKKPEKEA